MATTAAATRIDAFPAAVITVALPPSISLFAMPQVFPRVLLFSDSYHTILYMRLMSITPMPFEVLAAGIRYCRRYYCSAMLMYTILLALHY
jgi:hypothetical protein